MNTQHIAIVKSAAKAKYPTVKKMYPNRIQIVKNSINGIDMYLMPIKIDNGSSGTFLYFSMYI